MLNDEEILDKYQAFIHQIANKYLFLIDGSCIDKDDLLSEGRIAILKCCKTYRDDKNSSFLHYCHLEGLHKGRETRLGKHHPNL